MKTLGSILLMVGLPLIGTVTGGLVVSLIEVFAREQAPMGAYDGVMGAGALVGLTAGCIAMTVRHP